MLGADRFSGVGRSGIQRRRVGVTIDRWLTLAHVGMNLLYARLVRLDYDYDNEYLSSPLRKRDGCMLHTTTDQRENSVCVPVNKCNFVSKWEDKVIYKKKSMWRQGCLKDAWL